VQTAHAAMLLVTLTFAVWNVMAESFPTQHSSVLLLCASRDVVALAALGAWFLASRRCARQRREVNCQADPPALDASLPSMPCSSSDWALLAAVGLSGPFLAPLATMLCVSWSDADVAGILNALAPAIAGVLAVIFCIERSSWRLVAGVTLGTTGGLMAAQGATAGASRPTQSEPNYIAGVAAGVAMSVAQALFLVGMKPLLRRSRHRQAIPSLVVIGLAYAIAFIASVLGFCGLIYVHGLKEAIGGWGKQETLLALYAGLVCGAMNFSLITWANQILPATVCALYGALQPPSTALIAFVWKGESLTTMGYVSMALIAASLVLVSGDCRGSGADGNTPRMAGVRISGDSREESLM